MKARNLVLPLLLAAALGCPSEPVPSLAGTWDMIAYRNDGVTATSITGTATFASTGTVTFNGVIQFPGQPPDTLAETETWAQTGRSLTLTVAGDTSEWELTFSGDVVAIQLLHDASASLLTLRRR
jgi:hypothetical protein